MTDSPRSVLFAHPVHQRLSTSSGITTQSRDQQRQVERSAYSQGRPPHYPRRPSQLDENRYLSDQRSITRRRRELGSAGTVVPSGSQNAHVPRQQVEREVRGDFSKEVPSRSSHTEHACSSCHSGWPMERMKAESSEDTLRRVEVYEWVKGRIESAAWAARERERQRCLEEEFLLRLSMWKAEGELRNMREQEMEQDAQEFGSSGVYTRARHQQPRYWTASKVWNKSRGFADIALIKTPPFGVKERRQLFATRNSYR